MDLSGAIAGGNAFFEQNYRNRLRDQEQQRFDWERQKAESELSLLPDKTESERSGYRNTKGKSEAEMATRPGATANTIAQQGLDAADLKARAARQPIENQAKDIQAQTGLTAAQGAQAQQPFRNTAALNAVKSDVLTSEANLAQLPAKLAAAGVQSVIDQQGQSDVVIGTLGNLIASGDKSRAIAFANAVAKQGDLLPNSNGKTFTDITETKKGENGATQDGFTFVTSDGQAFNIPTTSVVAGMAKIKSGKFHFLHTADGSVYAGNENTGSVTQVHKGDPTALRAQHQPAEIQLWDRLIAKGVAKNDQEAWNMVRTARSKNRDEFIKEYVLKNTVMGNREKDMANAKTAGDLYDELQRERGGPLANPAPSNSGGGLNLQGLDPRIQSLIGPPQ